jgi:hypothetical protein
MGDHYKQVRYEDYNHHGKKEGIIGDVLGEVPIIGELFESLSKGGGKKGAKKFCCCCAPLAIILIIPLIFLAIWLFRGALSLLKIDPANFNWLENIKSYINGLLPFDQITQWFGGLQNSLSF